VPVGTAQIFAPQKLLLCRERWQKFRPHLRKKKLSRINIMQASGGTLRLLSHARPSGLLTGVWLAFVPQTSHIPET